MLSNSEPNDAPRRAVICADSSKPVKSMVKLQQYLRGRERWTREPSSISFGVQARVRHAQLGDLIALAPSFCTAGRYREPTSAGHMFLLEGYSKGLARSTCTGRPEHEVGWLNANAEHTIVNEHQEKLSGEVHLLYGAGTLMGARVGGSDRLSGNGIRDSVSIASRRFTEYTNSCMCVEPHNGRPAECGRDLVMSSCASLDAV
ncbi:hypothetical protein OBBRIDRAFT_806726 [Obba rivulosa]|uniref:Uncharacterized protein n=1 Tax=Obba rivulosa TaxID=1052685 RepID=A0A8E2ATQ6_9APHY|nr:hypothetical protein OBBRIDRAFT_806726 [Obba rivulosa]